MIYLYGELEDPNTWILDEQRYHGYICLFGSKREARSWVIEEIKRRAKDLGRIKDRWMRERILEVSRETAFVNQPQL